MLSYHSENELERYIQIPGFGCCRIKEKRGECASVSKAFLLEAKRNFTDKVF